MGLGNIGAVFLFEWRRALTGPRMAWWAVLAGFPVFIVTLIRISPIPDDIPREPWTVFLFALVPMLVCMLGTFLWTTPALSAELERRSWVYLATRPNGCTAVLLGKYLAAVAWVLPAALIGLTVALFVAQTGDAWRIWSAIARLACLSCPAYAAVYLVLGTLFPNRSMVIAVAYTLVFELIIGLVPAVINTLTVQYRIRALLVEWAEIGVPVTREFSALALIGDSPAWHHVAVLVGYTLALLLLAVILIRTCEYSSAREFEV